MIITICLFILVYSIFGKYVGNMVRRIKDVDWKFL